MRHKTVERDSADDFIFDLPCKNTRKARTEALVHRQFSIDEKMFSAKRGFKKLSNLAVSQVLHEFLLNGAASTEQVHFKLTGAKKTFPSMQTNNENGCNSYI